MAEIKIRPRFDLKDVKDYFQDFKSQIEDQVIKVLIELADRTAEDSRLNAEFLNHSYNLRSSIGTVVFKSGTIIHRNFKTVGAGNEGYQKGQTVAERNIPSTGIGMMLVAGEDYALYVEARDNKWVISGSSLRLAKILQRLV